MTVASRRLNERVKAALPVSYRNVGGEPGGSPGVGVTDDVSECGARVITYRPLWGRVGLSISFGETTVTSTARVVHVTESAEGRFVIGMTFVDMDASGRAALKTLLRSA